MAEFSSPVTFRDFVQHLLPVATALCLFLPLSPDTTGKLEVGGLVFAAVILGYLVAAPIIELIVKLYAFTPVMRDYHRLRVWSSANWDFDRLFYGLSQEEREYIYVTGGYMELYRQLSFYLLVYVGVNLFLIARATHGAPNVDAFLTKAFKARTPFVGGLALPTALVLTASIIVAYYLFLVFLNEFQMLFHEDGQYVTFAKRVHEKDGGVALGIWGRVTHQRKPLYGVKVELLKNTREAVGETFTNADGSFQFSNKFRECVGNDFIVRAAQDLKSHETAMRLSEKQIPFVGVDAPFASEVKPKWQLALTATVGVLITLLLLSFFREPDPIVRILYLLSGFPFLVTLVLFTTEVNLKGPKLSASLLLSVTFALSALALSFSVFAGQQVNESYKWHTLVPSYISQRWYDLVLAGTIVLLFYLNKKTNFDPLTPPPVFTSLTYGPDERGKIPFAQNHEQRVFVTIHGRNLNEAILTLPEKFLASDISNSRADKLTVIITIPKSAQSNHEYRFEIRTANPDSITFKFPLEHDPLILESKFVRDCIPHVPGQQ